MDINIETILGSVVLSTIVSAWVTRANTERKIYIDNITKERAKWRDRIRSITSEYPHVY